MEEYIQLPLTAAALRKWLRFADRGGIGQAVSLSDRLAESGTDELMFMEGEPITVLVQLDNERYLGSCEGVVGIFHGKDVRFVAKLKKPVFTKKHAKPETHTSTSRTRQSSPLPKSLVVGSPAATGTLSPAQTLTVDHGVNYCISAPESSSAQRAFQNHASEVHNTGYLAAGRTGTHPVEAGPQTPINATLPDFKSANNTSSVHGGCLQSLASPTESLQFTSIPDIDDDILSSYVYSASADLEEHPRPWPRQQEPSHRMRTTTSISPHNKVDKPASLLETPDIPKLASDSSSWGYLQEQRKPTKQGEVPAKVIILPNLPAGVSLKQLRERSSPRYPLSPRSISDGSSTAGKSNSAPRGVNRPLDAQPISPLVSAGDIAHHVEPCDPLCLEKPQSPLASPVPSSSFGPSYSPALEASPTSPFYREYDSPATSTSAMYPTQPAFLHRQFIEDPCGHAGTPHTHKPSPDSPSDTRSFSSFGSSSRALSHSRSLSSLTRASSLVFQRRPSLPTRADGKSGNLREDGLVELSNAQFELVQPQGSDFRACRPDSAIDGQAAPSFTLITRSSVSAKERVKSIYVTKDSPGLARDSGFIHEKQSGFFDQDLDISDTADPAFLQAYRVREQKWITTMSTMSARNARSSGKVKKLIYHGIPNSVRGKAWTYLAEASSRKEETLYHDLCAREELPQCAQITHDIVFCFHDHSHFADEDAIGRQDLHSILHALLHYLPNMAYERGLCYMAGMLLLHLEAESAFWLLAACVLDYLPGYFAKDRLGSALDANILLYILQRGEPDLIRHLQHQGVQLQQVFESWLTSTFIRTLPWASQLTVMDLFFFGDRPSQLGIRIGLAVMDLLRDTLLSERQDSVRVLQTPPLETLKLSALLPTLLSIRLPSRTLKRATIWAQGQLFPL